MKRLLCYLLVISGCWSAESIAQQRVRDHGIEPGIMPPGAHNAITDVSGVLVGHSSLHTAQAFTGVTAILPHQGNLYREKVPAAIHVGNGFGKLAGFTQVRELGTLETPVLLTNTLSVPMAAHSLIKYMLGLKGNERVRSVNPVVGETNDGGINDIRGLHIGEDQVLEAIENASGGPVEEGCVGAGSGTVCFGFKGGIGTASRVIPDSYGGYTVGVLVQSNFGGVLTIDGVPVGEELGRYYLSSRYEDPADGSCMIVVATDAPLSARNLERLAKRAMLGLARTGGISSNGSGDYVIAFSTAQELQRKSFSRRLTTGAPVLRNDRLSPLFMAVIEAAEEAILNSLFTAETVTGPTGRTVEALPVDEVLRIMKKYGHLK